MADSLTTPDLLPLRLQTALRDYRVRAARDSGRMRAVQAWCCEQLRARGVAGVDVEIRCSGAYRDKNWDVALVRGSEVLLAISTKTLVSNHGGSVPNRIDDMIGEAANLHRQHPRAVLGYLAFMHIEDESQAWKKRIATASEGAKPLLMARNKTQALSWFTQWGAMVTRAGSRQSEHDPRMECSEVALLQLIDMDSVHGAVHASAGSCASVDGFFDQMVEHYHERFG